MGDEYGALPKNTPFPADDSPAKLRLWYDSPAGGDWNRALPIGNGKLGAMVFGEVATERLQLNEDSLWHGGKRDRTNPDALEQLPRVRELLRAGELQEAQALLDDAMAGMPDGMSFYEPLADVFLGFAHGDAAVTGYRRELDLETAATTVEYTIGSTTYRRTCVASEPAQVIALRLEANAPGSISLRLRMERRPRTSSAAKMADTVTQHGHGLLMQGRSGGAGGVHFALCLQAQVEGGECRTLGDALHVKGADAVTLVLAAATTFREASPAEYASRKVEAALATGWEKLRAEQARDHQALFQRMHIELSGSEGNDKQLAGLPTDARLQRMDQGAHDPAMAALYAQFGRYLLISCSRPGSLPATLQGIWNQDFWPSWGCKYTINVNTEMNYWLAGPASLPECQEPLFAMLERVHERGKETARRMYGCRGFVVHHNTDLWADTCPTDRYLPASYWVLGGAWLSLQLWEHYAFTRDAEFLKRSYPILRDASQFLLDFAIHNAKGELVLSPSVSPENSYRLPNGQTGVICEGCTFDAQLMEVLFRNTAQAAETLGCDGEFRKELVEATGALPKPQIGKNGQLLEWLEEYEELEPQHRHISHAFSLHPGDVITPRGTPALANAVLKTLEIRGDEGTGWSIAWKTAFYARLHRADKTEQLLANLLRLVTPETQAKAGSGGHYGGTYPNLLCAHPPFQIDGNLGGTAAILEMILQSHEHEQDPETGQKLPLLHLLPACPASWHQGRVAGIRARGGVEVNLAWRGGELLALGLRNLLTQEAQFFLLHGGELRRITLAPGELREWPGFPR